MNPTISGTMAKGMMPAVMPIRAVFRVSFSFEYRSSLPDAWSYHPAGKREIRGLRAIGEGYHDH